MTTLRPIPTPANLVHIVLEGGFPPVTAGNPLYVVQLADPVGVDVAAYVVAEAAEAVKETHLVVRGRCGRSA